jgi:hypothetical protein
MAISVALDSTKPALAAMFHKVTEEALEFRTPPKSWLSDKLRYNRRPTANRFPMTNPLS